MDTAAPQPAAPVLPGLDEQRELTWKYTATGVPLVIGDVPNVIDRVREEFGWQIWYLVASKRTVEHFPGGTHAGKTYKAQDYDVDQPKVFKVVDNMVGWSVHEAPQEVMGLSPVEQSAMFKLPKIPWVLIHKMDQFFRKVASDLRTEAIVILTWNPKVGGPEGWGCVVPNQTNSAGHCNYEHDSIVDAKDDDAFVVGTAHSHPGMSAFASGTDAHDQADFDGLHITFGWINSKNQGATEFHIEMQMGGKAWQLKPEQIFLDPPVDVEFPEVADWRKQVKATPVTPAGTSSSTAPASGPGFGIGFGYIHEHDRKAKEYTVPKGWPDPADNLLIVNLLDVNEEKCPACATLLDPKAMEYRRCHNCWNYLLMPDEDVDALIDARKALDLDLFDLGPRNTQKPLQLVMRTDVGWTVKEVPTAAAEVLDAIGEGKPPLAAAD